MMKTEEEEGDLEKLMTTNKCLAMEKRELHRQKLRAYSEKAVKLRAMLRETTDPEEKKCIESKLKGLQQKQDSEITKLTKIDEIEKQIDGFITQENEDITNHQKINASQSKFSGSSNKSVHDTPAQRLRTKSSITCKAKYQVQPYQVQPYQVQPSSGDFSRKKSRAQYRIEPEEILLRDSRQVMEELTSNRLNRNMIHNQSKQSDKQKNALSAYSNQSKGDPWVNFPQIVEPVRLQWNSEEGTQSPELVEGIPQNLQCLVQKITKFWPLQIQNFIKYVRSAEQVRLKYGKREEKLKRDEERVRRCEERSKNLDDKVLELIQKQRFLMETIDRLERQERSLEQQVQKSLITLTNAAQVISRSSIIPASEDPVQVNCFVSDSVHKFSVESFQSFRQGSTLAVQLSKFQKALQDYMLSAEKAVMMVNAEYQRINSRLSKAIEDTVRFQSRKKVIEQEMEKTDNWFNIKKNSLRELQEEVKMMQQQASECGGTAEIKKALALELEQKCEKFKLKKKSLAQRIKRMEQDIEALTIKKEQIFETVINLEQKIVGMKTYEKELETKIIFCERDKENREKDILKFEQKGEEIMKRIQESNRVNEDVITKISHQQVQILQLSTSILEKQKEESSLTQQLQTLQQELSQSKSQINQHKALAQEQNQKIVARQAQLIEIQSKIDKSVAELKEVQLEFEEWVGKINQQKQMFEKEGKQMEDTLSAKFDLEGVLHEIMLKKEEMMGEVEERSKQLTLLLGDLYNGQEDYEHLANEVAKLQVKIEDKQRVIRELEGQYQNIREELDEELQEESNIMSRLARLKEVEKTLLLGIGAKGGSAFLDEQLKERVRGAVQELNSLNDLKSQLKECKYQNRKLRLENQLLNTLVEGQ